MVLHSPIYMQWEEEMLERRIWWGRCGAESQNPGMASQARDQEQCSSPASYRNTSAVPELSMEGLFPVALLGTCIFTLEERFSKLRAGGISAFPFLKIPITACRWWTLPASAAGCRTGYASRPRERDLQLSMYVTRGSWIYSHQNCWRSFWVTSFAHQGPCKGLGIG